MNGFRIALKAGHVDTDARGRIVHDYSAGRNYRCAPHDSWRIVGIATRHLSRALVSLAEAADGASIGQGWVHDLDHGTHRTWCMPRSNRAVKVRRIRLGRAEAGR